MDKAGLLKRQNVRLWLILKAIAIIVFVYVLTWSPNLESDREAFAYTAPLLSKSKINLDSEKHELSELQSRPIFHPNRRLNKVEIPPARVVEQVDQLEGIRLVGVVMGSEDKAWAYLEFTENNKKIKLHTGETVAGWMLHEIRAEKIVFEKGETFAVMEQKNGGYPIYENKPG